jgi:hypothetical protein
MSPGTTLNLSNLVNDGQLFTPPGDPSRVEAFILTPFRDNHAANLVELASGERNEQLNRRLSHPCLIPTRDGALHAAYSY